MFLQHQIILGHQFISRLVILRLVHQNPQQNKTQRNKYVEHFKTLDLPPDASRSSVRQKYIELVKKHHPDTSNDGGEMFNKIDNAFRQLMNKFKEDQMR